MPVDSPEGDRGAVQSKNEIPDLYAPEADLFGDDFTAGVHDQCVERRTFSAPKRRIINVDGDGPIRPGRDCFGEQCFAISALQCKPDREGRPAELKAYAELRGCEVISQISLDDIVLNMLLRTRQNIHIPEDSGETELILILKIAAVTPLKNQNGQKVVSILQKICNVELSGVV